MFYVGRVSNSPDAGVVAIPCRGETLRLVCLQLGRLAMSVNQASPVLPSSRVRRALFQVFIALRVAAAWLVRTRAVDGGVV